MNIAVINGSPRKEGSTSKVLQYIKSEIFKNNPNIRVAYYDLSETDWKICKGCEECYSKGVCMIDDGFEAVAEEIKSCDAIILGSPTYGSNVTALVKNFMDRGHFIIEQSLYNKTCFSLVTYEIADGVSALKVINKFFIVAGGKIRNKLCIQVGFNKNPLKNDGVKKRVNKEVQKFLKNLLKERKKSFFQYLLNDVIVVNTVWKKYFSKNPRQFRGAVEKYRERDIHKKVTEMKCFS